MSTQTNEAPPSARSETVDAYLDTIAKLEPLAMVDYSTALTSLAISVKRIADIMERELQP